MSDHWLFWACILVLGFWFACLLISRWLEMIRSDVEFAILDRRIDELLAEYGEIDDGDDDEDDDEDGSVSGDSSDSGVHPGRDNVSPGDRHGPGIAGGDAAPSAGRPTGHNAG